MALERVFPGAPGPTTSGRGLIASPFQFLITGEDNLELTCWSSVNVTVAILGRFLLERGGIQAFDHRLAVPFTRLPTTQRFALAAGFMLNVHAIVIAGESRIGQTFVQLKLIRGFTGATVPLGTLIQGYCATRIDLSFPGNSLEGCFDGPGNLRAIEISILLPGAEILETVPVRARWRLLSLTAGLTTSGVAGTRGPTLVVRDPIAGGQVIARSPFMIAHPPATGISYHWIVGMPHETVPSAPFRVAGLPPDYELVAGATFGTLTVAFDAGDSWDSGFYYVREWIDIGV